MKRHLLACLLALAAAGAHAGMGMLQLPATTPDGPVTVFYPTGTPDQAVQRGPFTLQVAPDAPPVRGNGRLVAISHGSGGNPFVHTDLAHVLVDAGFTVVMPEHQGDNARDPSTPGPASWKQRPAEVSRAIDAIGRDSRFAPLLSLDRVGMYGMSAGGHTALTLAGGRWSPARLREHCEAHIADDFAGCVGLSTRLNGDALDEAKKTIALALIRRRLADESWYAHVDPRIQAVVAGVPFATDFDRDSLASPRVPLALVTAGRDRWLVPRFHSGTVLQACLPRCELLAELPSAGHGALLSPLPPLAELPATLRDLIADPPGFDRSQMAGVDRAIAAWFARRLVASQP
jgi:predicted dienelactone hydrolase